MSRNSKMILSVLLVAAGYVAMMLIVPALHDVKPDILAGLATILVIAVCISGPGFLFAYMLVTGGGRRRKKN